MYNTQNYSVPFGMYRNSELPKPYKTLEEALNLVKNAVEGEREDELFYDYLISVAPTQEEKSIITTIRDDERKHNKYFREIYSFYTGQSLPVPTNVDFQKPKSFLEGIKKAKFGELAAVEKYRDIRAGLPDNYYKDMVFEILTDELKHADKYDYILYLTLENGNLDNNKSWRNSEVSPKTSFTTQEAMQISKKLNIDFNKERFDLEQFRMGLDVELEHGRRNPDTNVTNDDSVLTGKIALANLRRIPDYYIRLSKLEYEAKLYWSYDSNNKSV